MQLKTSPWSVVVCVLLGISLTSCQARPETMRFLYPDDLKIEAIAGGLMSGSVQHVLEIGADGKGRFARYYSDEPGDALAETTFTLNGKQLETLWKTIQEQNFFTLEREYINRDVDDGAFASLTVTARGRTHQVEVENTSVPRLERILNAINQVTPPGIELPYQGFSRPD